MISKQKILLILVFALLAGCLLSRAEEQETPGNFKNFDAVKNVLSGKYTVANAAWWGFDENDSTDALKGAIASGARTVVVPYMGKDWIVRRLRLRSNLELIFEPGVVVTAKKGAFKYTGDGLFKASDQHNITLRGYGAILRMQKRDYMGPGYEQGQWRMVLGLAGCTNVKVQGLTLKDSGGDGIFLGMTKEKKQSCKDILIEDCTFDNNYRQGISVISAENLRIDNCIFKNTSGSPPGGGIDLEPDNAYEKLSNIVISNCVSINNEGPGFVVGLHKLNSESSDISILFYNCYVSGCKWGMQVLSNSDAGPRGLVEFRNCTSADTAGPGIWVVTRTNSFDLRFSNCKVKNASIKRVYPGEEFDVPIFLRIKRQKYFEKKGHIEFDNCYVHDQKNRPAIRIWPYEQNSGELNVKGNIHVKNRHAKELSLGLDTKSSNLLRVNRLPQ